MVENTSFFVNAMGRGVKSIKSMPHNDMATIWRLPPYHSASTPSSKLTFQLLWQVYSFFLLLSLGFRLFVRRYITAKARVLILGCSLICCLHEFTTRSHDNMYTTKLGISTPEFICKWHSIGRRTIAKVWKYDSNVLKKFGPDIIILQLGTNDLVDSSPLRWVPPSNI